MNRQQRRIGEKAMRSAKVQKQVKTQMDHWTEIRRLKAEYDRLPAEQKAEQKPVYAAEIDSHLTAIYEGEVETVN